MASPPGRPPGPPDPLPPRDPAYDPSANHYWLYHRLDDLLACKQPVTASPDEDLFIAVHQICELAFHQAILDAGRAVDAFARALDEAAPGAPIGDTTDACYFLRRVIQIVGTASRTVPVLRTLRAFAEFRGALGPSSGFQSVQLRHLEILFGVDRPYWTGGTADREGRPHAAEVEFERRYGAEVRGWFDRHRHHSLRHWFERLVERAPGADRPSKIAALRADHHRAGPLVSLLHALDHAWLHFHRTHRALAVQQLSRVGVRYGTGGTDFKRYLAKYEREVHPLYPGLEHPARPAVED